jgi:hypothetical protein
MLMDGKITRENIDEHLTAYIDGQVLSQKERDYVSELIRKDKTIYNKYRTELLTRDLLRSKFKPEEVPQASYVGINDSIDNLLFSISESRKKIHQKDLVPGEVDFSQPFALYIKRLFTTPVRLKWVTVPAYSFVLVFFVLIAATGIFLQATRQSELNPFITSGSDNSVMVQAVNNFHKILSGEFKTELNSNNATEVSDFVRNKTKIDAYIPDLNNCKLQGAVCNEYNGEKLAHIVYTSGDEVIYIYETKISGIHCKNLELPDPVHKQMIANRFYMCDHVDRINTSLMLWYKDSVLCASVSNIPKHKLFNTFAYLK